MAERAAAPERPLTGDLPEVLAERLAAMGEPPYRARQLFRAFHAEGRLDPQSITTLPAALRERLASEAPPATTLREAQEAADGTTKLLLGLADGRAVESVLIPENDRVTVCVSTQVGCPIRCIFCASGVRGLLRNLTPAEIVEPLIHARARLGKRPTHIVLMGMGEPLLNLDAVVQAIRIWTHPDGMGMSPRRITVSTALTPQRIDALAAADLGVNLAVSLHAPDDVTRAELVPGSPVGRVKALVEAAARFATTTRRDATVEYVLIDKLNDQPAHAEALADVLEGLPIHVNLIPFNPVSHRPDLAPPSGLAATGFARRLAERNVSVTLRTQRGEDIAAACGQLALERALGEGD